MAQGQLSKPYGYAVKPYGPDGWPTGPLVPTCGPNSLVVHLVMIQLLQVRSSQGLQMVWMVLPDGASWFVSGIPYSSDVIFFTW